MKNYKDTIIETLPYLRRYARALTGDIRLADRMVQQCIDCATDLHQLIKKDQNNAIGQKIWLFSIFHNIYNEFITEQQVFMAQWQTTELPANEELLNSHEDDKYYRAFKQLPLQQQQVFLLVSVEKFLYEEVSKIVNLPLGAILSLLHTARNSIAEKVYSPADADIALDNISPRAPTINNDEAVEVLL